VYITYVIVDEYYIHIPMDITYVNEYDVCKCMKTIDTGPTGRDHISSTSVLNLYNACNCK